jgi:large subunit ribosomal protein L17e
MMKVEKGKLSLLIIEQILTKKQFLKVSKARGLNLKVHFKNTREVAHSIKGLSLNRAKQYLQNVIKKTEIVPFVRYRYGVGRKAQLKKFKATSGRWPVKSALNVFQILKNAESNANEKGLDPNLLYIKKIEVNKAMKGHRRTFRAHGRVNGFLSHPCHIDLWLIEKNSKIERAFTE